MVKREKLKESDMQRTSHEVQNCTISFCRNSENPQQISLLFISFVKNFEDEQENKSNSEEIMVKKSCQFIEDESFLLLLAMSCHLFLFKCNFKMHLHFLAMSFSPWNNDP